jgi:hypothetical protein
MEADYRLRAFLWPIISLSNIRFKIILALYAANLLSLWYSGQSSWLQIQRSGFDSRCYQIFRGVVGLERVPLSLMSTTEELLGRESSGSKSRKSRILSLLLLRINCMYLPTTNFITVTITITNASTITTNPKTTITVTTTVTNTIIYYYPFKFITLC